MANLKTTFAGLKLKNPVIISSSGLTNSAEKNKKLEEAGAAAVVLKSLFEEQIMLQTEHLQNNEYPEASDYLAGYLRSHTLNEYISLIQSSKKVCNIPVIASINCFTNTEWTEFAKTMELAGADALELNVLALQTELNYTYGSFEQRHIDILRNVKSQVNIPVIMKLGSNLTNPAALIDQLYANGADGIVLFNRFYQPDIDLRTLEHTSGEVLSHPGDISASLRWVGICSAEIDQVDYAVSGGVSSGYDVVKSILSGASAVELCSAVYRNGREMIQPMLKSVEHWMHEKGYESIPQFKGILNASKLNGINYFERTQFLKYFGEKE